jgi:hypothetical protein
MRRHLTNRLMWLALGAMLTYMLPAAAFGQGEDRDCRDFSSQQEAQQFFETQGGGDPHDLDRDNDGTACEEFDYGTASSSAGAKPGAKQYPRGGIGTGGGSTANGGGTHPLPLLAGGGALMALTAGAALLGARRRT